MKEKNYMMWMCIKIGDVPPKQQLNNRGNDHEPVAGRGGCPTFSENTNEMLDGICEK